MQLLQDKLAEKIWLENQYGGYMTQVKVESMMEDCNLKYRKGKTYSDLVVAIGNGYKNNQRKSKVVREQLAEELDKVLIRKRWDF